MGTRDWLPIWTAVHLVGGASWLPGQTPEELERRFEGRLVVALIDMPATKDGIDIRPERSPVIDYDKYIRRVKGHGISIRRGDTVMITKIKVKKKLIEFQLGGGGYGTLDDHSSSGLYLPVAFWSGKSKREKNLEADLKRETDPAKRRGLEEERDGLRRERERHEEEVAAELAAAEALERAEIRRRALSSGSRFNIRFDSAVPFEAATPQGIRQALAPFVDFSGGWFEEEAESPAVRPDVLASDSEGDAMTQAGPDPGGCGPEPDPLEEPSARELAHGS